LLGCSFAVDKNVEYELITHNDIISINDPNEAENSLNIS